MAESTTATMYWGPVAVLIVYAGGTVLVNGLAQFGGGQIRVDEKGGIYIDIVSRS